MYIAFERKSGCWSELAVIYHIKLEGCLEGLARLLNPGTELGV